MEAATAVLAGVFVMFLLAKIAGELLDRLRQPAVIGELLVGMVIGPYALGWVGIPSSDTTDYALADGRLPELCARHPCGPTARALRRDTRGSSADPSARW